MAEATAPLSFRILRLGPPQLSSAAPDRFNVTEDMEVSPSVEEASLPLDHPYADRLHRSLDEPPGPSVALTISTSFGPVYLGQKLRVCVVLCNLASYPITGVSITVVLQTDRGQTLLHDARTGGSFVLDAGASHSLHVEHDVKDVGPHALVCSAVGYGEHNTRTYHSQSFRFSVTNPITVRSKQRVVDDVVLLEVVLESAVSHPFLLTRHVFLPHSPFVVEEVLSPSQATATTPPLGPLRAALAQHPLLTPQGGQLGLVYRLRAQQSETAGPRPGSQPDSDGDGPVSLGRLDLEWTGAMGEVARLQTQSITMSRSLLPKRAAEVSLRLLGFDPPDPVHETPFAVRLEVANDGRRATGPMLAAWRGVATRAPLVADGPHATPVAALAPGERRTVALRMLPLLAGQHGLLGLMLVDERSGTVLDTLAPQETSVLPG